MVMTGGCACGALSYSIENEARSVAVCNCTACKRRTGSAFGIGTFFSADDVSMQGDYTVYSRRSDAGRDVNHRFCPQCGTTVGWTAEAAPGMMAIAGGTFDDPGWVRPKVVAWAAQAMPWVVFPDDVPVFDASPHK